MNVGNLLRMLADCAVELCLDGDRLRYRAPQGALTANLRGEIAAHRLAIIEHLQRGNHDRPGAGRCVNCDWRSWQDDPPKDGRIRTTCGKCGQFIGYRPVGT